MERRQFVLLVCFLLSLNGLNAQQLVKENKLWSNTWMGCDGPDTYHSSWIKFEGDTIINDTAFKKIFRATDQLHMEWQGYGAIREDSSGRVYLYQNNRQRLLYDFSVEIGDTLKNYDGAYDEYYVVNVEYIHPEFYRDSLKKIEICAYTDCNHAEGTWIESIGSMHGILLSVELIELVGGEYNLVCMYENDTLKYHNDYYNDCFPQGYRDGVENVDIDPMKPGIVYSNDHLEFEFSNPVPPDAELRIVDIAGRLKSISTVTDRSFSIMKRDYEKGIYVYTYQDGTHQISGKFIIDR